MRSRFCRGDAAFSARVGNRQTLRSKPTNSGGFDYSERFSRSVFSPYVTHQMGFRFWENADKFIPERWNEQSIQKSRTKIFYLFPLQPRGAKLYRRELRVDGRSFVNRHFDAKMEISPDARTKSRSQTADDSAPETRNENGD